MTLDFVAGDVFYTRADQQYRLFKVVATDPDLACYHVAIYVPQATLPAPAELPGLPLEIGHAPISADGFDHPVWLAHQPLTAHELAGYHTYLQHVQSTGSTIDQAIAYFNDGLALTDAGQHDAAIEAYAKAAGLVPQFYEALDNRAFCFMDLGRWPEAIAGFEQSLQVNPANDLAVFSIGECYFNLRDDAQATAHFEQALQLNPASALAHEFLAKVAARAAR